MCSFADNVSQFPTISLAKKSRDLHNCVKLDDEGNMWVEKGNENPFDHLIFIFHKWSTSHFPILWLGFSSLNIRPKSIYYFLLHPNALIAFPGTAKKYFQLVSLLRILKQFQQIQCHSFPFFFVHLAYTQNRPLVGHY